MPIPFVDLNAQYHSIKEEIDAAIAAVIEESAFIRGRFVERFEEEFAAAARAAHCVSVANGTDALYIVLRMLGIGPGDEVITSACSWISSSETITQAGAEPVFADIEPDYFTLDPSDVERRITPRTKAVIAVHLLGQPADMPALRDICDRRGLLLVEDCAQAHLAEIAGRAVGTWGNAGTFSFYPGKNLGAYGDAGAIVTEDRELAANCRCFARHGADAGDKHNHVMEGINSRLDGLQAAILSVKLQHLEDWTKAR
ncbi:MAG TPA: DegT/DnrJ/EryC1/StrS family aminotransferase, partial [Verrucomicrobiales bacterium]|nr:DegT/DnrJ/EryC1/StrS family aminotransferase [Verrucomicrobiales bacterium]